MQKKILIIEDDQILAETLCDFFTCNNLKVIIANSGTKGVTLFNEKRPHLVLLDVQLPDINGFEVISIIHKENSVIPVIFMTGTELDPASQIKGYNYGAINYIAKPVIPEVLLAQILSLIEPYSIKNYKFDNITVTINTQYISINNIEFCLREKEVQLMVLLLDNANKVIDRKIILLTLWGEDNLKRSNQLDVIISRLKDIFKANVAIRIEKVYGVGYRLHVE